MAPLDRKQCLDSACNAIYLVPRYLSSAASIYIYTSSWLGLSRVSLSFHKGEA